MNTSNALLVVHQMIMIVKQNAVVIISNVSNHVTQIQEWVISSFQLKSGHLFTSKGIPSMTIDITALWRHLYI